MLSLPHYRGTTVGVLGLGPSAVATVDALVASGARVIAWDGRESFVAPEGCSVLPATGWPFDALCAVVMGDGHRGGHSLAVAERAHGEKIPVLTDMDLFAEALAPLEPDMRPQIVAVTGAAGKSVTVSIIAHLLREQGRKVGVGGELGSPLLSLPGAAPGMTYVLEMPVQELARTKAFPCDISVVLSLGTQACPDAEALALRSIGRIFKTQGPGDRAVIAVDEPMGQKVSTLLRSGRVTDGELAEVTLVSGEASLGQGIYAIDGVAYAKSGSKAEPIADYARAPAFDGGQFGQCVAAALAVGRALGLPDKGMERALMTYRGLKGRFEYLGNAGPLLFIDDSRASTPIAAHTSAKAFPDVFWIGGTPGVDDRDDPDLGDGLRGRYALVAGGHRALSEALIAAVGDAERLAATEPEARPVVLFSPGCRPDGGGYSLGEFRSLATAYIQGRARSE